MKKTIKKESTNQPKAKDQAMNTHSKTFESPLHEFLGMTHEDIVADTKARGLDPATEIASMRRLSRVLTAKYRDIIEKEDAPIPAFEKLFPIYREAVAAGSPEWAGAIAEPERASLMDVLGRGNVNELMWARVSGWSMKDEGIKDGDLILVDTSQTANDGDIVLANVHGLGQVVKRLRLNGKTIILESANPDYVSIEVNSTSELNIQGVVVGRAGKM